LRGAFAAQQVELGPVDFGPIDLRPMDLLPGGRNDVALDAATIGSTGRGIIRRGKN
jgi:hypothetical protein